MTSINAEEKQKILSPDVDFEHSRCRRPRIWMWFAIGLLTVVAVAALVFCIFTFTGQHSNQLEKSVTFELRDGKEYDTIIYVDAGAQTEELQMPVERKYGELIVYFGSATIVHDFKAGYSAYKVQAICYLAKLNDSFIKYNPENLLEFLNDYKQDQKIPRIPQVKLVYSVERAQNIPDISMYNSQAISEVCNSAQRSILLGPGKETAPRIRRFDALEECTVELTLWIVDVELWCETEV